MPIITPAFPAQNTTHNVSDSTKRVMLTEIEKAHIIIKEINKQKDESVLSWQRLFKKFSFFRAYNHFIMITALSKNEEQFKQWQGFVESKVRQMLYQLQNFSRYNFNNQLEFRPWPKTYRIKHSKFEYAEASFIGIRFKLKADVDAPLKSDV